MKVRVLLKDPDTMHDAVECAFERLDIPDGLVDLEWSDICEERARTVCADISERWMRYGEYLCVEFDTELGTATVIPNSEQKP